MRTDWIFGELIGRWRHVVTTGLVLCATAVGCGEATSEEDAQPKNEGTNEGEAAEAAEPRAQQAAAGSWCAAKAVFDKNCVACHDGKGTGGSPMGLTKPSDFTANAPISTGKKVGAAVTARMHDASRPMPPRGVLPAADLQAVDAWISAGMPAGTATCASTAPAGDGSQGGFNDADCDEIYELRSHGAGTSPYMVPNGETHPQVSINPPWGGTPVQAIGWRPITDNGPVLHHWILYNGFAFLTGWAPGDDDRPAFPKDVGMDMPTGAGSLRLDFHYFNTTGKAQPDRSGVAICAVKGAHMRRNHAAVTMGLTSFGPILAPANNRNFTSTGSCTARVTQPVHLMTAAPHAHKLAKHMKFVIRKRSGQTIVMHDQPFKFGEQGTYALTPEVIVENGDVITTACTFDNPTSRNVTFGESTNNEMCFNFAMYYPKGALSCGLL